MKFTKENVLGEFKQWRDTSNGATGSFYSAIMDLDDTPEKVVIPKFVDWWIRKCRDLEWGLKDLLSPEIYDSENAKLTNNWLLTNSDNQEIIARAWFEGYEVEKELLYHVALPKLCDSDFCYLWIDDFGAVYPQRKEVPSVGKFKFTEQEIKAIDERYWPFAVRVGDEHENNE